MRTLIENGLVYGDGDFTEQHVLVEDGCIAALGAAPDGVDRVIDARGMLVIPGLVNAHIHSHDNFNRGVLDNLPLEVWMIYIRPFYSGIDHSPREVYLRTLIGCIEMLKSGTTAVMDDVLLGSPTDEVSLAAVMQAYEDSGMRAVVTPHTKNLPMYETIPYLNALYSEDMKARTTPHLPGERDILAFLEGAIRRYNRPGARFSIGLSPSAPQRCTLPLLQGMKALSQRYGVPTVSHVLETYVQKRTGELFYDKSLVAYLEEHGLLYPEHVLVHTVWADQADLERIARHGCRTVHNPACNAKMGSGIAPIRELRNLDVAVGLGTDNISANDSANLFEAMKVGGLLSKLRTPDYSRWLGDGDLFDMATMGGARCLMQADAIGSIEVGKRADITMVDTANERFAAAHDYRKALVYGENGASVRHVMVEGRLVVENGRMTTVDERAIYAEVGEVMAHIRRERAQALDEAEGVVPIFEEAYRRANAERYDTGR